MGDEYFKLPLQLVSEGRRARHAAYTSSKVMLLSQATCTMLCTMQAGRKIIYLITYFSVHVELGHGSNLLCNYYKLLLFVRLTVCGHHGDHRLGKGVTTPSESEPSISGNTFRVILMIDRLKLR